MTKIFRDCRYEVYVHPSKGRWSRHHSIKAAQRAYREAVNNHRGDHSNGSVAELRDVDDNGGITTLAREVVRAYP